MGKRRVPLPAAGAGEKRTGRRALAGLLALLLAALLGGCTSREPEAPQQTPAVEENTAPPAAETPEPAAEEAAPDGGGTITFTEDGVQIDGTGASAIADGVRISTGGSYTVTGGNRRGAISVFAPGRHVQIILNSASLYSGNDSPLSIVSAGDVELVLAAGTENSVESRAEDDGAVHSEAPLTISGEGTLSANNPKSVGILVRNNLTIAGGRLILTALEDGIRLSSGALAVTGGSVYLNAQINGINAQRNMDVSGGTVFSFGGNQNNGSGLLLGGALNVTGGSITAAGAFPPKAPAPGQPSVSFEFPKQTSGTTFAVTDAAGAAVTTLEVPGESRALFYSGPGLQPETEYTLTADGTPVVSAFSTGA